MGFPQVLSRIFSIVLLVISQINMLSVVSQMARQFKCLGL